MAGFDTDELTRFALALAVAALFAGCAAPEPSRETVDPAGATAAPEAASIPAPEAAPGPPRSHPGRPVFPRTEDPAELADMVRSRPRAILDQSAIDLSLQSSLRRQAADAYVRQANRLLGQGDAAGAVRAFLAATLYEPEDPRVLEGLRQALAARGPVPNRQDAEAAAREAAGAALAARSAVDGSPPPPSVRGELSPSVRGEPVEPRTDLPSGPPLDPQDREGFRRLIEEIDRRGTVGEDGQTPAPAEASQ